MWRDEGVRQVLVMMGPAVIAGSAVQVNVAVNNIFASHLGDGAVSSLGYAFRLMQLPLGVFGVAVATVTLPVLSAKAALGNTEAFRAVLAKGIRLVFFLTIPSALGLAILGEPIIRLIFERHRFNAEATLQTAAALQYYAIGLAGYSGLKVLAPAFYARERKYTPMVVSIVGIGLNLLLNWIFTFRLGWGHKGLAFSTGVNAVISFAVLYGLMHREIGRMETTVLVNTLLKVGVAGGLMGLVCVVGNRWLMEPFRPLHSVLVDAVAMAGVIGCAGVVYVGTVALLKVDVTEEVIRMIKRKLKR